MKRTLFVVLTLVPALISTTRAEPLNVVAWGANNWGQTNVPPWATNVVAAAAGTDFTIALRADGTAGCWGHTNFIRSAVPAAATNLVAVSAGRLHMLGLRADGTVIAWGDNVYGQTDVPSDATNVVAIASGYDHNIALKADGSIALWGMVAGYYKGFTNPPPNVTNVVAICASAVNALVMKADGQVLQLGMDWHTSKLQVWASPSSWTNLATFSNGYNQNLGVTPGGGVVGWGGYYIWKSLKPPAGLTNVVLVASATNYNLALTVGGQVLGWGLGAAANVPPSASPAVGISAGVNHAVAVLPLAGPPILLGPVPVAFRSDVPAGDPYPLYVRAVGSQPLRYQWLVDGLPLAGMDTPFPQILAALPDGRRGFQVVVANSAGAVTSAVAYVTVRPYKAWGNNHVRQLNWPAAVTNPAAFSAGAFHSLAAQPDGTVVAWGKNADQQCDVPATAMGAISVAAGGDHSLALKADGTVVAWGRNWDGQTNVPAAASGAVAISAGWAHSLALRSDGHVIAWGNNDYGQTNTAFIPGNLVAVSAGYFHNLALRSDGSVVTWGWEVPVPANAVNVVAVSAGWEHCLALRADGTVVAWGDNTFGQSSVPANVTNAIAISAGYYHNLALLRDGSVVAWGKLTPRLRQGPIGNGFTAIRAGEDFSLALIETGAPTLSAPISSISATAEGNVMLCAAAAGGPATFQWYHNGTAVLGATNLSLLLSSVGSADAGEYVLVATGAGGASTTLTQTVTVASAPYVDPGGTLRNAGVGQTVAFEAHPLGSGPLTFAWQRDGAFLEEGHGFTGCSSNVLVLTPAETWDSGSYSLVVSNSFGVVTGAVTELRVTEVVGWGDNSYGQCSAPLEATNLVAVSAGALHSLALQKDGTVIAWGDNSLGQTDVPTNLNGVIAISAGGDHNLALKADGSLFAWGDNTYGLAKVPVGLSNVFAIGAGSTLNTVLYGDTRIRQWGIFTSDFVLSGSPAIDVAGGATFSVLLRSNRSVLIDGNLWSGTPPTATNTVAIAAGLSHALFLRNDQQIISWGNNYHGGTDVPSLPAPPVSIAAGEYHSLALLQDGTVEAWGADWSGQSDAPSGLPGVEAIAGGGSHSLARVQGNPRPVLSLSTVQGYGGGQLLLHISRLSGRRDVHILTSTNLVDWRVVKTVPPAGRELEYLDRPDPLAPGTFYKVVESY